MANGSRPDTALDLFDNSMETFAKILNKIHITPVTEAELTSNTNNDYRFLDKSEQDKLEHDNPKPLFWFGLDNPKPVKTVQVKSKQDKPELDQSEKEKSEQNKTEQDKTIQNKQEQGKHEQDKPEKSKPKQDKLEQSTASTTLIYSTPICVLKGPAEAGEIDTTLNTSEDKTQDLQNTDFNSELSDSQSNAPFTSKALASVGNKFDKDLLMSLYTWNLGTATIQVSESTTNKSIRSFPFRNKRAASLALALKHKLLNNKQKTLPTDCTDFKAKIPSFPATEKNISSLYVFGSQKTITTIFNKETTSQCILETEATMINNNNDLAPAPNVCSAQESGYFSMAVLNATSVYGEGKTNSSPSSPRENSTGASSSEVVKTTSKFAFENSNHDEFGNFLTTLLVYKSPAQRNLTRPSNELKKINIDLYKYENYNGALAMFNDVIKLCPDNITFYGVRCHYYMKAGMYKKAIQDAQIAIAYDPYFTDGYICFAKYYVIMGSIGHTSEILRKVGALCDGSAAECRALDQLQILLDLRRDMQRACSQRDFLEAVVCADLFLEMCPSIVIKATKAQYLAMLGQEALALATAEECLRDDSAEPEAQYAKGLCLYCSDELQQAVEYFQQVLAVDPFHAGAARSMQKAKELIRLTNEGKESLAAGRLQEALRDFKEALRVDDIPSKVATGLHCKNAEIYLKLNNKLDAIAEYTSALEFDNKCVEALRGRAYCYADCEDYGKAIDDYEKIYTTVEDETTKRDARDAIATLTKRHEYQQKAILASSLLLHPTAQNVDSALRITEECLQFNREDAKALCLKGSCLYHKGELEEALDVYQQALILRPDDLMALRETSDTSRLIDALKKGEELFAAGKWNVALENYDDAIAFAKTTVTDKLYCKKAEIYLKLEIFLYSVIDEYTNALSANSMCVQALRGRAKCYTDVDRYEDAVNDYEKLYSIDRSEATEQLLNDCKVKMHCKKAAICLKSSGVNEAISEYTNALCVDSECVEALRGRAKCYTDVDRYEDAANDYDKLYSIDQSEATEELLNDCKVKMHCKKAAICLKSSGVNEAISEYTNALCLDSECLEALRGRAKCYTDVDRYEDAANDYEKLYSIDQSAVTEELLRECKAKNYCEKAAKHLKSNEINQAIAVYTLALWVDSECVEALRGRAKCYTDVDRYEDAANDYEKLYSIDQSEVTEELLRECKAKNYCQKAAKHLKSNEINQAIAEYSKALSEDSKCVEALRGRAKCYIDVDRYKDAEADYEILYSIDRSEATEELLNECKTKNYCQRAAKYLKSNEINQAVAVYTIALCLDKKCVEALRGRAKCYTDVDRYEDAATDYEKLYSIDRNEATEKLLNECKAKNYCQKAAKYLKSNEINHAIAEYTKALSVDSQCVEALRGRSKCYTDVDRYEDAANDYEKLYSIDRSEATKQLLYKCKTSRTTNYGVAQEKAEMGKAWYESHNYKSALAMFEEAIRMCPDRAEYRAHSFCCYIQLAMLREAAVEAKKAVDLYVKSSESFSAIAKCYIALGDLRGAERAILKASAAGDDSASERRVLQSQQRLHAQAQQYIEQRDCERAVSCIEECMKDSPFSVQLKLMKAHCLAMLGQIDAALETADECIRSDRYDAEAHFVKGLCLYYNAKDREAMNYFKHALHLYPDHKEASAAYKRTKLLREKINQGTAAFEQGRWRDALQLYGAALRVDATHVTATAQLHLHMASAHRRLGDTRQAENACVAALDLHEKNARALTHAECVQALSLRAACLVELGEYQDAVDDYERLYAVDPRPEVKELWDRAKRDNEKSSRNKDYYQILGVPRTATKAVIEKAYKRLRALHHPDRHAGSSEFVRRRHERRFQALLEAYTQLGDDARRRAYDDGSDSD